MGGKSLRLLESHFKIALNGLELDQICLKGFLESEFFKVVKRNKKGDKIEINARPLVKSLSFSSSNSLYLVIKHASGPGIKPLNLIKEIFDIQDKNLNHIKILKIRQVSG